MPQSPDYDFYSPIAGAIRKIRSEAKPKISQEELAEKTGLSRAAIANIERGRQQILVHVLYKIAKALNVSPIELLPSSNPQQANTTEKIKGLNQADIADLKKKLSQRNFENVMKRLGK